MKFYYSIVFFILSLSVFAQNDKNLIELNVVINGQKVILGENYFSHELNDSIQFKSIRFYLSNFQFIYEGKVVDTAKTKYLLVDLNDPSSMQIGATEKEYDAVRFNLGIDSVTNYGGALGGDLDPVNGMYWSWQSGYINVKLEGISPSVANKKNDFQFHLGGFMHPYNSLQVIHLKNTVKIELNLSQFLRTIDLKNTFRIMSPSVETVKISKKLAGSFQ